MNKTLPTALLAGAMALAGCAGGASTPSPNPTAAASLDPGMAISATLMDFNIELSTESVTAPFTVSVLNNGPTPHDLSIRDGAGTKLFTSNQLSRTQTGSVPVPELGPGEYTYYCSLPGHESLGMKGTLTVTQ